MKFSQTERMGTVFTRSACVEGPQKVSRETPHMIVPSDSRVLFSDKR